MTLAEARALLAPEEPHVEPFRPERDLHALQALAVWALRFSPVVALDPPDGLLVDLEGLGRLAGGEQRLIGILADAVETLRIGVRAAAADSVGCAWAVARFGHAVRTQVPTGSERDALAPLPVQGLRLDPGLRDGLHELGVETIGQLLRLSHAELSARFGTALPLRINQALGRVIEPLVPIEWHNPPQLERSFDGPVRDLETIMLATRATLDELVAELVSRGRAAWELRTELISTDLPPTIITVVLSRPSHEAAHLWTLLRPRLECASLGFGIERIELTATRTAPARRDHQAFWLESGGARRQPELDEKLAELVDVLSSRLGARAILMPRSVASHVPEQAFPLQPFAGGVPPQPGAADVAARVERPSKLLAPPEALRITSHARALPDRFGWRRDDHHVLAWHGPERIAAPWWASAPRHGARVDPRETRDYFRVHTTTGRALWVFRELDSRRWFVHGEWI